MSETSFISIMIITDDVVVVVIDIHRDIVMGLFDVIGSGSELFLFILCAVTHIGSTNKYFYTVLTFVNYTTIYLRFTMEASSNFLLGSQSYIALPFQLKLFNRCFS